MEGKQITKKDQIIWYLKKIVDHLSEAQAQAVLGMLQKFWMQREDRNS